MNPFDLHLRHTPRNIGIGAACTQTAPGQDTCRYLPGAKEPQVEAILQRARARLRESLSNSSEDVAAMRRMFQAVRGAAPTRELQPTLLAMRDELRLRVGYVDDPPGLDTVQTLAASLRRGWADCVSLTIALTAMGHTLLGAPVVWIIGGTREDPSRHIWPVIGGLHVEASDPMPQLGQDYRHLNTRRIVQPW